MAFHIVPHEDEYFDHRGVNQSRMSYDIMHEDEVAAECWCPEVADVICKVLNEMEDNHASI